MDIMLQPGVYAIRNLITGDRYVGSSMVSFKWRWCQNRSALRGNRHHNPPLQSAWNTFGESSFCFEPLVVCARESCVMYEQSFIESVGTYNIGHAGHRGHYGHKAGPQSAETRAKIGEANRGKVVSDETRELQRKAHAASSRTYVVSEASRLKMSLAKRGKKRKPFTAEHKAALSAAAKLRIRQPVSDETRAKQSAAHRKRFENWPKE